MSRYGLHSDRHVTVSNTVICFVKGPDSDTVGAPGV